MKPNEKIDNEGKAYFSMRLKPLENEALNKYAAIHGMNRSDIVRAAIEKYISEERQNERSN
jgi:metal-responsive CopG/Arc/MetJ family transcriptional regulator